MEYGSGAATRRFQSKDPGEAVLVQTLSTTQKMLSSTIFDSMIRFPDEFTETANLGGLQGSCFRLTIP